MCVYRKTSNFRQEMNFVTNKSAVVKTNTLYKLYRSFVEYTLFERICHNDFETNHFVFTLRNNKLLFIQAVCGLKKHQILSINSLHKQEIAC